MFPLCNTDDVYERGDIYLILQKLVIHLLSDTRCTSHMHIRYIAKIRPIFKLFLECEYNLNEAPVRKETAVETEAYGPVHSHRRPYSHIMNYHM